MDYVLDEERESGKLIAFGWYGGKFSHLAWLLPYLPKTKHYCEPFAGSAAVLLNREPSPVETYNDLDCDLMDTLYSDWHCAEAPIKMCHSIKQPRQEVLWMNYTMEERAECPPQQVRQIPLEAFLTLRLAAEKANAFDESANEFQLPQTPS